GCRRRAERRRRAPVGGGVSDPAQVDPGAAYGHVAPVHGHARGSKSVVSRLRMNLSLLAKLRLIHRAAARIDTRAAPAPRRVSAADWAWAPRVQVLSSTSTCEPSGSLSEVVKWLREAARGSATPDAATSGTWAGTGGLAETMRWKGC